MALVADDGIGFRTPQHLWQMLRGQVRRAQHQTACDTIELNHGERGGELLLEDEHDASTAQLLEPSAEARSVSEISEWNYGVGTVQAPAGRSRGRDRLPERALLI